MLRMTKVILNSKQQSVSANRTDRLFWILGCSLDTTTVKDRGINQYPTNHGTLINVRRVFEHAYGWLWRGTLWPCGLMAFLLGQCPRGLLAN